MMKAIPTLHGLAESLLAGKRLEHSLCLRFGSCAIRLATNSPQLVENLRRYFRDFLAPEGPVEMEILACESAPLQLDLPLTPKPPDPGKQRVKEEYLELPGGRLVRKRLTGMVFAFGPSLHLAVGPCLANDNQVVNFINSRHIQWLLDQGYLLAHAAGVRGEPGGLALAGFSGMGKSTLALHLVSHGLDFVSNDRLLIRRGQKRLEMQGVAKLPRINPGTALNNPHLLPVIPEEERDQYSSLSPQELWRLERKYDAYLDDCYGPGRFRLTSPMRGLVILNWRGLGGPARLEQVDLSTRHDLLSAFMKSPGLFYLSPQGEPADFSPLSYVQALAGCPVFELSGEPDFAAASRLCLEALRETGAQYFPRVVA